MMIHHRYFFFVLLTVPHIGNWKRDRSESPAGFPTTVKTTKTVNFSLVAQSSLDYMEL